MELVVHPFFIKVLLVKYFYTWPYLVLLFLGRLYALQIALTIDKSSKEAKSFLIPLMDWLEKQKNALKENDMITNETAAQAHLENYAVKLFNTADTMDLQKNYNK